MFYTHPCCDQSFDALKANDYTFDNLVHLIITKLLLVLLMGSKTKFHNVFTLPTDNDFV